MGVNQGTGPKVLTETEKALTPFPELAGLGFLFALRWGDAFWNTPDTAQRLTTPITSQTFPTGLRHGHPHFFHRTNILHNIFFCTCTGLSCVAALRNVHRLSSSGHLPPPPIGPLSLLSCPPAKKQLRINKNKLKTMEPLCSKILT